MIKRSMEPEVGGLLKPYDPQNSQEQTKMRQQEMEQALRQPFGDRYVQDILAMIQIYSHPSLPGQDITERLNTVVKEYFPMEQSKARTVDAHIPAIIDKLCKLSHDLLDIRDEEGINQADVLLKKTYIALSQVRVFEKPMDEEVSSALGRALRGGFLGVGDIAVNNYDFVAVTNHMYWEAYQVGELLKQGVSVSGSTVEVAWSMVRALQELYRPMQGIGSVTPEQKKGIQSRIPSYPLSFSKESCETLMEELERHLPQYQDRQLEMQVQQVLDALKEVVE